MQSKQLQYLPAKNYERQPWKNGKGETREIARDMDNSLRWRLSTAVLSEDGLFSIFSGYDRVLILLDGGPINLHAKQQSTIEASSDVLLQRFDIYQFSGDTETFMKISSPGHDLNIFTKRNQARARVALLSLDVEPLSVELGAKEQFFYCADGQATVSFVADSESRIIACGDTFRISDGGSQRGLQLSLTGLPGSKIISVAIEF